MAGSAMSVYNLYIYVVVRSAVTFLLPATILHAVVSILFNGGKMAARKPFTFPPAEGFPSAVVRPDIRCQASMMQEWQLDNVCGAVLGCSQLLLTGSHSLSAHFAHQVPMVLAATPARHCVCGHFSLRMLAAYACHSICTCIVLLGSPQNAVHLSSIV